ncbi:hypothetical protein [Ensifer adhaerens]|uniref:hypothetical protein n=1 Tax=Ensifer adhaerens TaxID=106592 RepID=UPI001569804C|nr:hypothetical protein [Ensifer adhaerens]
MALVGDDQNGLCSQSWVPIDSDEGAGGQFPYQRLIEGRIGEVEDTRSIKSSHCHEVGCECADAAGILGAA